FYNNALVFENPVERPPSKGAVRSASLQGEINSLAVGPKLFSHLRLPLRLRCAPGRPGYSHSSGIPVKSNASTCTVTGASTETHDIKLIGAGVIERRASEKRVADCRKSRSQYRLPEPIARRSPEVWGMYGTESRSRAKPDVVGVPEPAAGIDDDKKTKKQLVDELSALRQRIRDLEAFEAERKAIATELKGTRQRLQYLLAVSPAIIYTTKATGDYACTFVSENLRAIMGYTPQEMTTDPKGWPDHLH